MDRCRGFFALAFVLSLLSPTILNQNVEAHGTIDQDNITGKNLNLGADLTDDVPSLQEFKPSESNLVAIDVSLTGCHDEELTVTLYSGTIDNHQLQASLTHTVESNDPDVPEHIEFVLQGQEAQAIDLSGSQTWIIELKGDQNVPNSCKWRVGGNAIDDIYPDGEFKRGPNFVPVDAGFRTYYVILQAENEVIGGIISDVDTSTLLLAGIKTGYGWAIPLLFGVIIISAVFIKKRTG